MSIDDLIKSTINLKNKFLLVLTNANVVYDKVGGNAGNGFNVISICGEYKIRDGENRLEELTISWNLWYKNTVEYTKFDRSLYNLLSRLDRIIQCGWRINNDNIQDLIEMVKNVFDKAINVLEQSKEYEFTKKSTSISAQQVVLNISSKQVSINVTEITNLYVGIQKIVSNTNLTDYQKEEIKRLIDDGLNNPDDIGQLTKVFNYIHEKLEKLSPEMSLIGTMGSLLGMVL